ncbi:DNA binding protein DdbA [Chlamydia gallinacea]|uniref:Uncharacterized protein n=2 Tax=Chlamydia gallinacea TaxID=1457153 RepID=A0A173DZW7_9CHLA|nr:hypothetical protein [Chlamydia gallinacea]EYE60387.1 hypothetical protein M127_5210 [Bacteroides fragilis str. S6L5]ANG66459.1 hypothetical protein M787_003940 [Chlamydia gallinacea 08-1274/3]AQT77351.1 hypothetical protein B1F83_01650 [Chlamydia gallinacea]MBX6679812.1 hypothetical protein [Chlamydia gallinacea]MBX6687615.1 hypothetical protein [Chlamydia gallinacea]
MVVEQSNANEEMEKLILKAIKKVCGNKENDLCRYLPGPSGGYMHHFTLKKMKTASPEQFLKMLKTFILESDSPRMINPKPRAPRGSKKRRDFINFTKTDIERVLELARRVGDKDLLARFSPKKPLPSLKRELIRSIRNGIVSFELWNAYVEAVKTSSSNVDSPQSFV